MQAIRHGTMLPSLQRNEIGTSELDPFRSSILGPWSPLSTLHGCPREQNLVHHSGSGWLAKPSPWGTSTSYSLPASWRTPRWVRLGHVDVSGSLPFYPLNGHGPRHRCPAEYCKYGKAWRLAKRPRST
jgi:hypothetical protein